MTTYSRSTRDGMKPQSQRRSSPTRKFYIFPLPLASTVRTAKVIAQTTQEDGISLALNQVPATRAWLVRGPNSPLLTGRPTFVPPYNTASASLHEPRLTVRLVWSSPRSLFVCMLQSTHARKTATSSMMRSPTSSTKPLKRTSSALREKKKKQACSNPAQSPMAFHFGPVMIHLLTSRSHEKDMTPQAWDFAVTSPSPPGHTKPRPDDDHDPEPCRLRRSQADDLRHS